MALIECLIDRDGPTTINDGGFKFVFKENEAGHCVCDVLAGGVVRRLLSFSWFRKYQPDVDYRDTLPAPDAVVVEPPCEAPELPLINDEHKRIVMLHEEGHSLRAIGSAVGRSPNYVSKVIKGHN